MSDSVSAFYDGLVGIAWLTPEESGYYQPIVLAKKPLAGVGV